MYLKAFLETIPQFDKDGGWQRSSHIALSMMFALFPFCIFALSLAGLTSSELNSHGIVEFVVGAWPEEVAKPIVRELDAVLEQSDGKIAVAGALLAIFFASNGVDAIRVSISVAYREEDNRPMWKTRLLCVVFVLVGGGILTFIGAFLVALPIYFNALNIEPPEIYLRYFGSGEIPQSVALLVLVFAVVACHKWLPGVPRPITQLLPGVVLTVVLWAITAKVFEYYLVNYSSYSVTYAGLAGVMAALLFMYLMAVIFVFGAEYNAKLARLKAERPAPE